jgi:hypothetical protein
MAENWKNEMREWLTIGEAKNRAKNAQWRNSAKSSKNLSPLFERGFPDGPRALRRSPPSSEAAANGPGLAAYHLRGRA